MRRLIGISLAIFLLISPSLAQEQKLPFDGWAAWSYIKALASDSMLGRKSGQPGGVMGEEYIASQFKKWGLEPAGDKGTYFQNFTIEHRNIGQGVALDVMSKREKRSFYYREDWRVQRYSGSGRFTAEIVFVGYGIHAPEKEYDDYAGVDVKGKLVLLTSGAPPKLTKKLEEEAKMENRIKAAHDLGALGVIGFRPPSSQSRYFSIRINKESYQPDFVLLSCEDKVVNFIFKDLDKDLRPLYQDIDKTSKPHSFETGIKAFVSVDAIFDEKRATRNVLAKITGTDEISKKETDYQIVLPGDILFDYNTWNVQSKARASLRKVGEVIKALECSNIVISGHTDSKGREEYNQEVSEKRAQSIKNWFVSNEGIRASTIETIGYGETKPIAPNTNPDGSDNPEGRQKNRRVEIIVKVKNEYVILGAHMDHLGIGPLGDVYNGANDNASGTAVVMEIARIMKLNKTKPKRTVIFALWAGEEQGLLGSRHYVDHTPYPVARTIACLNMDMVGHGSGKIPFNGVYYGPRIWEVLKEKLPKEIMDNVQPGRGGPGGSDHTPFLEKGIPAFFLITRGAIKYHRPRDDSDLIKPEMLKKTGDLVHAAVNILASEPGNFIEPMRQETYYIKNQTLINYELSSLDDVIKNHGETKDSHVNLQLAVIEEKEGLSGDELRLDIIRNLFDVPERIKRTKGLSSYSSSGRLRMDARQGKAAVMAGLKGLDSFRDDPRWADVLAKQGVYFVFTDDPSVLFDEKGLNEEGKKIVKALNSSGLLLCVKGASASQATALLKESKKPLVFLERNLPDKEVLELIKEKESAIGLILGKDADPVAYFKKLNDFKEAIGTQYLMMVNEECLWGDAGKNLMLKAITEIIKAKFERFDLSNIFSGTFLRVMNKVRVRAGDTPQAMRFMPF